MWAENLLSAQHNLEVGFRCHRCVTLLSIPFDPPERPPSPPLAAMTTSRDHPDTADRRAAVGALFHLHQASMLRVATVLVRDRAGAEDVVQDAFLAVYASWPRIQNKDDAVRYLRRTVVNLARNQIRRRALAQKVVLLRHRDEVSAEEAVLEMGVDSDLLEAVAVLPRRERETVLMRYYLDLSEQDTADALGIRTGSVKAYASRGLAKLRLVLDQQPGVASEGQS